MHLNRALALLGLASALGLAFNVGCSSSANVDAASSSASVIDDDDVANDDADADAGDTDAAVGDAEATDADAGEEIADAAPDAREAGASPPKSTNTGSGLNASSSSSGGTSSGGTSSTSLSSSGPLGDQKPGSAASVCSMAYGSPTTSFAGLAMLVVAIATLRRRRT
jgi:MYXO-CTERM domain-containing protein